MNKFILELWHAVGKQISTNVTFLKNPGFIKGIKRNIYSFIHIQEVLKFSEENVKQQVQLYSKAIDPADFGSNNG